MDDRRKAFVIKETTSGYVFAETDDDLHQEIFIHRTQVANHRVLHTGDRVELTVVDNPRHPGSLCGIDVRYVSRTVARQTSGKVGGAL